MDMNQHLLNIRKNIIKMVANANSGHLGGALSAVEILTVLYFEIMNIDENNLNSFDRDRFVLSKGHASALLYAVLNERGLLQDDLLSYRMLDSNLQGHPNMNLVAGVDMSTGSLAQGLASAVGMAMANKLANRNHRIYVLLGDGECEEGEVWEAAMAAAHYKLDNLCVIVDNNGLQISGNIENVMNPLPLDEKFRSFGWNVNVVNDGHDILKLKKAFDEAKKISNKPSIIIAKTIKGKGISFMENKVEWHGKTLDQKNYFQALNELERLS
ncbi:MAG: transketolase [Erysipelotrichaceae bacterium]|nr:transketolase [Erysipelotrichaceae bacterium]MDY5251432.1 transketolase [Erysipelotrichaceae bacterium]